MQPSPGSWVFRDSFPSARIGAAAIYCSDGRFGEAFDEFLHTELGLPHYDRVAIPGGAAALAGHIAAHRDEEALRDQLRFLIDSHGLERIVLIAHRNCGFYLKKLHVPEERLLARQEADLCLAADAIRLLGPHVRVDAYLAAVRDARVTVERVPLDAPHAL